MALKPGDALAQFIAADLAFHADDCAATVDNLQGALNSGLGTELARQFLKAALERRPDCSGLLRIQDSLGEVSGDEPPATDAPAIPNDRGGATTSDNGTELP